MLPMTSAPVPLGEYVPTADRRIVLRDVGWAGFHALRALRGEGAGPRMAYLDGSVELMAPSRGHETINRCLGLLVAAWCEERQVAFSSYGSWLLDDASEEAGAEPDDCYVFGPEPARKPRPDLVIEVEWTRGGLAKLEIYRRLQVPEVWFWKDDAITVHVLGPEGYEPRASSAQLPELELALVARLARVEPMSEAIARLRAALRAG